MWFTLGTTTTCRLEDKIELVTSLCYLTDVLKKADKNKYKSSVDVLNVIYKKQLDKGSEAGFEDFLVGLSVICDDFMFGVQSGTIPKPNGCENAADVVKKIKILVEQWLPF